MSKIILWVSRYLLAITFIFSGIVKGVDPLGSAYKFGDYFMAFGLDFFMPLALPMSFILCAAELLIGLMLLFNIRTVLASWGALIFMAVFTPLTLVLAIYNPVSDCGCFGDALILTNWQTFFKNLPLLGASAFLIVFRKKIQPMYRFFPEVTATILLAIISFMPSIHGYYNLPLFDFRPYSIGTNIQQAMEFPENAPHDEYKTVLYYQKDGITKEFTQENFPWQDSSWVFVDSKSILVKKGYEPPIKDFVLTDFYGWDKTDSILHSPGYFLVAIAYRLDKANAEAFTKLNELYYKAKEQQIGFVCITSSPATEIDRFISSTGVAFPFLMADEIMLKTIIRSNPGILLLNEGTIIGKWHYRNLPESKYFEGNLGAKTMKLHRNRVETLWVYLLIVIMLFAKGALAKLDPKNKELE